MNKLFALLLAGLMLAGCSQKESQQENEATGGQTETASALPDGVTLVEQAGSGDGQIRIPYRKYRLDNGLTVILHEDQSDPLIHVDVTYHVGSAREEAQRSGFAHFFEHMMFQGSQHVGDDEHFKIVTEAGGRMNGTTNNDRTNYFETVPKNNLETMLWLEADRMGFLLPAVTQEKFEIQRATVKNERGQNYDNRPYGLFNEINSAALYPVGHPYSWPVIGYPADLDAATLDDLKRFFLRWYGPNNATLTIGGDIDTEETLKLVKQYFGSMPAGPEVEDDSVEPVALDGDRYVSYVDKNIRFPALMFTFPTVPMGHPDAVALEALSEILAVGKKSYMYKQFVLSNKAIEASSFNNIMELAGNMTFFVLPYPNLSLSNFEVEMREMFDSFNADSISDEDIQIFKATNEAALVEGLASVQGKVSRLAYYQTFYNDPDRIQRELEALRALTKDDVLRVFNKYIKDQPAVVQSVVPESNPDGQARPDNFELPGPAPRETSQTADLQPRPVQDSFDRSVKPEPDAAPLVTVPDFWKASIAGQDDTAIDVIGTQSEEVPLVTLRLDFHGGHLLDNPDKHGLAALTAALMNEGTDKLSAEDFEKELDKLGSRISVNANRESTRVSLTSLRHNLDATIELLKQRLFASSFTPEDLERLRQQTIEGLEANKQQPNGIASDVYRTLLYGKDHPLSVSSAGKKETLEAITLEDVEAFAKANLNADNLQVVVVGDIDKDAIVKKLDFLKQLPAKAPAVAELPPVPDPGDTTLYLVDKPGAAQSEIRIGYMTDLPYDATGEYFKRYLMNYVLGGAFSSRINLNLREDKGYTYGARSGFSGSKLPGPFTASASVKKDSSADSVRQFVNEITGYRDDGITASELAFMKSAIGQSDALSYETPRQKAGFLGRIIEYDLPADFVDQQADIIRTITQDEINSLAKKYLPMDNMYMLVVGDKAFIHASLQELGYDIVELDAEGKPVQ